MEKLARKKYEKQLIKLQAKLVALQEWVKATGARVCIVFEGRDTAGKGGTIKRITERVSPRVFKVVALSAPTERERSQMYIQRYIPHFPAAGEVVQGGDLLGQGDRVGLHRQRDRGRQPDAGRDRRGGGQRDPRVEGAGVAVVGQRLVAGARVGRLPLDRDVGVLGHVERVEAPLLRGRAEGGGADAAVGGEEDESVAHAPNTRTGSSSREAQSRPDGGLVD